MHTVAAVLRHVEVAVGGQRRRAHGLSDSMGKWPGGLEWLRGGRGSAAIAASKGKDAAAMASLVMERPN